MNILITILVILLVYILPVIINRRWLRRAHSKGGIYGHLDIELSDLFATYIPFVNIASSIVYIFSSPRKYRVVNYNKHFKVKK